MAARSGTSYQKLPKTDPSELTEAHQILSCLVDQVYAFDGGNVVSACENWKALGYDLLDLKEDFRNVRAARWPTCKIRLMVFHRRDENIDLPKFVVAIRGTKSCKTDIKDDILIAFERLDKSLFYEAILTMTKRAVDKHPRESVCVAGHSLGAAFGLLVSRQIALDNMYLETHLFNPPFLSLGTLLTKGWNVVKSLVSPLVPKPIGKMLKAGSKAVKRVFNRALESTRDAALQKANDDEFIKLLSWVPHLYVNPGDVVCNENIHYFKKYSYHSNTMRRSSTNFTRLLQKVTPMKAKSSHLIPSAHLYISDRPSNKLSAHKLNQWYEYSDASIRFVTYNIVPQDYTSGSYNDDQTPLFMRHDIS